MRKLLKNKLEDYVEDRLKSEDFEDILRDFDIHPAEAFILLYEAGHIDDSTMPIDLGDYEDDDLEDYN